MLGSARDGSVAADVLRVAGIYHSGIPDLDRSILEMPLARAQDTFAMEGRGQHHRAGRAVAGRRSISALPGLQALGRDDRRVGARLAGAWSRPCATPST